MKILFVFAGIIMLLYLIGSLITGSLGLAVVFGAFISAMGSMSYSSAYDSILLAYVAATFIVLLIGVTWQTEK